MDPSERGKPEKVPTDVPAWALAEVMIPDDPAVDRYFLTAARSIFARAVESFTACDPGPWTLRDVMHALTDPDRCRAVLSRTVAGRDELANYKRAPRTFLDVVATIASAAAALEGPSDL